MNIKGCVPADESITSDSGSPDAQTINLSSLSQQPDQSFVVADQNLAITNLTGGKFLLTGNSIWQGSINEAPEKIGTLPLLNQRSYHSEPSLLSDGNVLITYQSSAQFGQNGTEHGFVIINPESGEILQTVDLTADVVNATNPEGAVEINGKLYVLLANRNNGTQIPELAIYTQNTNGEWVYESEFTFNNTVGRNASDIEIVTGHDGSEKILISCTATRPSETNTNGQGGVITNTDNGWLIFFDPSSENVIAEFETGPSLGIDMTVLDADADGDSNIAFLSGVESDSTKTAFGSVSIWGDPTTQRPENILTIQDMGNVSIDANNPWGTMPSGVETAKNLVLTTVKTTEGEISVIAYNPQTQESQVLNGPAATLAGPVLDLGEGHLIYVAEGTNASGTGELSATVFVHSYDFE